MSDAADVVVQGYDALYAAMSASPTLAQIWRTYVLGAGYPSDFNHISFATPDDLRDIAHLLELSENETLVDFACGAGGPGLFIAKETGARVIGVDPSAIGIAQARDRADAAGMSDRATFVVGTFAETHLPASTRAEAVMSIDAMQYAPDMRAALREIRRILRPQGRFVFTAFELNADVIALIPGAVMDAVGDLEGLLGDEGFEVLAYDETVGWSERVTATYEAVLASIDALREEMGHAAASGIEMEAWLAVRHGLYRRRVLGVASAR